MLLGKHTVSTQTLQRQETQGPESPCAMEAHFCTWVESSAVQFGQGKAHPFWFERDPSYRKHLASLHAPVYPAHRGTPLPR